MTTSPSPVFGVIATIPTGNLTAIRENGAASGVGVLASYSYDSLGRRSGVTFGNGTARSYGWDAAGRLAGISVDLAGHSGDTHSGDTIPIAAFTGVLKVGRVA